MEVQFYCPTPITYIPERVAGAECIFRVYYAAGHWDEYLGRISAVSLLFKALERRLRRDKSIDEVWVYLKSGRLLCTCSKDYDC